MTVLILLFRAVVTIGFLWCILRFAGKRSLRETGPFDLIIAFVLGNVAGNTIGGRISLIDGFVAVGLLVWAHLFNLVLQQRSGQFRAGRKGNPVCYCGMAKCGRMHCCVSRYLHCGWIVSCVKSGWSRWRCAASQD